MPRPYEILAGAEQIANQEFAYALLWHLIVGTVLISLLLKWRPSARLVGQLSTVPLLSVSVFAWAFDNPFNGSVFAILAAALWLMAWRTAPGARERPATWALILGWLMVGFAWVYPHFLSGKSALAYLFGSPMGLIPCPTLALVIGFALLGYGPTSRSWSLTLAASGVSYALFGVLRLGVVIDLVLLAGAIALIVRAYTASPRQSPLSTPAERGRGSGELRWSARQD